MFETLIRMIEDHQSYGPAMRDAAQRQLALVLNYHTHGPGTGYCVSICAMPANVLPVVGQALALEELVHVKGIGKTEQQCEPLMAGLSEQLVAHYGLELPPEIFLNGRPVPRSS